MVIWQEGTKHGQIKVFSCYCSYNLKQFNNMEYVKGLDILKLKLLNNRGHTWSEKLTSFSYRLFLGFSLRFKFLVSGNVSYYAWRRFQFQYTLSFFFYDTYYHYSTLSLVLICITMASM